MKGRRLVSTITLAASLLGVATFVHAAINPGAGQPQSYEVLFNGVTHIPAVKRATFSGRAYQTVTRAGASFASKDYANGYYPPAEFEMYLNGVQALAQTITDFSAGRPVRLSTQVRIPTGDPEIPEWTQLGDCDLAYVEFPKLDAAGKSPGTFKVRMVPTAFTPMTDKLPGTSAPAASPIAPFTVNNFTVNIPGLDCSHVMSVDGITVESSLNTRTTFGRELLAPPKAGSGVSNWNFTIDASGVTARGLRDWMLANQNTGPTKREITIQLIQPTGSGTLLTLHGVGVGLMSLLPPTTETADAVRSYKAELFVERWEIFPPGAQGMPKSKVDLTVPGFGMPGMRK